MWFKKKSMTKQEYVDFLLDIRSEIETLAIESFQQVFEVNDVDGKFKYEIMIFTLWIVTLCTPPKNDDIKDLMHRDFSWKYWGTTQNDLLFKNIDARYKNYYAAYSLWQQNPQSGHVLGTVIVEIVKNKNPSFSLSEKIPVVSDTAALEAFSLFNFLLETCLKTIHKLSKKYNVAELTDSDD